MRERELERQRAKTLARNVTHLRAASLALAKAMKRWRAVTDQGGQR